MSPALAALVLSAFFGDARSNLLIEQLGHDEYPVREAAAAALLRAVQSDEAARILPRLEAAAASRDPEVAWRAKTIVTEYYNLKPSKYALLPWIDMLPATVKERENVIREYCRRGREAGCPYDAPRWHDYRYATALYVEDLLKKGQSRADVQKMLDTMAEAEHTYKVAHKLPADY
jgi:hypothetical protein